MKNENFSSFFFAPTVFIKVRRFSSDKKNIRKKILKIIYFMQIIKKNLLS